MAYPSSKPTPAPTLVPAPTPESKQPFEFTDAALRALAPTEARYELRDTKSRGLRFVVNPSGACSFIVRYSVAGTDRKFTIGKYPQIALKSARRIAADVILKRATGSDPQLEKIKARQAAAASDTFGDAFAKFDDMHLSRKRESTAYEVRRLFVRRALPKLGPKKLADVTRADIVGVLDSMVKEAPVSANRLNSALHTFYSFAMDRGWCTSSPVAGLKPPTKERDRKRVLEDEELVLVWKAADRLSYPFGPFVKLLILTAARRDEIASMSRSELQLRKSVFHLPEERSKNHEPHDIHLTRLALDIIDALPKVESRAGFVFTTNGRNAISGFSKAKLLLDTEIAKIGPDMPLQPWTFHDFRRSTATGMSELGVFPHVVEAVLNHKPQGVAAKYNRDKRRQQQIAAWELWSKHIEQIVA
jgi:integrase